ncbi:helix-turn-helix domain-containing protein [uncultured Alistipes sp.]|uniref:helix-turn-helix domain-containing protein n=1 Tax=uncultured Alistipes sp. TaxID=538949 RepID=UPI00272D2208|nr:helix-turn-helix domain-containing protein [uncultured Alistipes sp.]
MKNYLMGQQDPCIKDILQRLEHTDKVLDRLSKSVKRTFNGERFISDSELSRVLRISRRTLQDYRSAGILPYYLISGKALYKESDVQQMLEKAYRPLFDNRNLV